MANPKKILIVDDSNIVRQIIKKELASDNYEFYEASNGLECLDLALEIQPDLITLDIEMPGENGFEICKKLMATEYSRHFSHKPDGIIPIIFITGHDNMRDRLKGFELSTTDFMTKPFPAGSLRRSISQILSPAGPLKGLSALIVDDSPIARKVLATVLERQGLHVTQAVNGQEALEMLADRSSKPVDLIVTDQQMPMVSGLELCQHIRQNLNMPDIPVIFLTANSEQGNLLEVFKAGGTDYLIKPFVQEELLARITVHLERMKLTKKLKETVASLQKANEEIRLLSITDPLTGTYNRGYINDQLEKEILKAQRYQFDLTLIICDVDHFKQVNDTHGHQAGDLVLKQVSHIIGTQVREKIDWVGRYGGEEFVVVLPHTNLDNACIVAERMRQALATESIPLSSESPLQITASFGLSSIEQLEATGHPINMEKLIQQADQMLYRAKENGRNCIES